MKTLALLAVTMLLPLSTLAADNAQESCINVQVDGYNAPSYDCLTRQMTSPEQTEAARKNRESSHIDVSKRAPNQLGMFNQSATSIRMGNQFGTSVTPQRPTP